MTSTAPHARATPDAAAYAQRFPGRYEQRVVTGGVGHNLPQEAPEAFTHAVLDGSGQTERPAKAAMRP